MIEITISTKQNRYGLFYGVMRLKQDGRHVLTKTSGSLFASHEDAVQNAKIIRDTFMAENGYYLTKKGIEYCKDTANVI